MIITLDISHEEFDGIVANDGEFSPVIFLNFPRDISGSYEFELMNTVINIFDVKDQLERLGVRSEEDSLFVFGTIHVRIEGVKGADFEMVEGGFHTGRRRYHSWPYTLRKGDVVCISGGRLSFLEDCYASIRIVAESRPRITLTFNLDETIPYDFMNSSRTNRARSAKSVHTYTSSPGRLFDPRFFREHFGTGRIAVRSEISG
ncbi:hypothetical protein LBW89_18225 [Paenibacillus sp. alder61]|uniref:Uncharacterized protein n=1 Tax=Paenibacillus faecis TaxID=862114 RepID=A0A5D0CL96_9BACL|nr:MULTISPECIES: hypothetical protein [Paenibacillus]MCA1294954.1 hypothetical protein [Paenibacillus sp. alder61]TYA10779.1 hypothetical protein FRY98_23660 [Paenibacillus faecis]